MEKNVYIAKTLAQKVQNGMAKTVFHFLIVQLGSIVTIIYVNLFHNNVFLHLYGTIINVRQLLLALMEHIKLKEHVNHKNSVQMAKYGTQIYYNVHVRQVQDGMGNPVLYAEMVKYGTLMKDAPVLKVIFSLDLDAKNQLHKDVYQYLILTGIQVKIYAFVNQGFL